MTQYLMIENPGKCPPEGFLLLGAGSKGTSKSPYAIGQFGSGCKHAIGVLLRAHLAPTVYCGNHRLSFSTETGTMKAIEGDVDYCRIIVKHGGKEDDGRSVSGTEALSQTVAYGSIDWDDIGMALREFVSNAIDACIVHNERAKAQVKYPFVGVNLDLVGEPDVRARKGFTRVFIPLTSNWSMAKHEEAILKFFQNIGRWFLHFSEPWSISASVLQKKNRNIGEGKTAVIYRRGVRVREIGHYYGESLFDYNLNDLRVDESRNVDDYAANSAAAHALSDARPELLAVWLRSFESGTKYWEHSFDSYNLKPLWSDSPDMVTVRSKNWATALRALGENVVVASKGAPQETLARKGFKALVLPEAVVQAADRYELPTAEKVLSTDERHGRVIVEATPDVTECALNLWELIVRCGMHKNKEMPIVQCFQSIMDGGSQTLGFQRDNTVYVNQSIAVGQSIELQQTMLEEMAHYITGALDETRDLQDWAFGFAVKSRMI